MNGAGKSGNQGGMVDAAFDRESTALLAEVSETLLGTRDGSHEQIRAALLAYRNAEETAYYDALERKEMEEPRAGDEDPQ